MKKASWLQNKQILEQGWKYCPDLDLGSLQHLSANAARFLQDYALKGWDTYLFRFKHYAN